MGILSWLLIASEIPLPEDANLLLLNPKTCSGRIFSYSRSFIIIII